MSRILLILEDSNQLNSIKIFLSKLGCAIETQGNELGLKDKVIAFRPDIVLVGGIGKKVNPGTVAQNVREIKADIKVIIVLGKGMKLSLDELADNRYDAFVESPFDPLRLATTLNKFKGKNSVDLVEKYQKLMISTIGNMGDIRVVGNKKDTPKNVNLSGNQSNEAGCLSVFSSKYLSTMTTKARIDRYNDLTFGLESNPISTISKEAVKIRMADLQKDWDQKKLEAIDLEKRRFVNELFRKK